MNISEHYTRLRAQVPKDQPASSIRVFGCLLGTLEGRNVDIANSFEVKASTTDGTNYTFDVEFLKTRLEQYKKVFKDYDLLGWYSTGSGVQGGDEVLHRLIGEITESPMYLVLNPTPDAAAQDLPIVIYESVMHIVNDNPTMQLEEASYKIHSIDSERISVDHVANISSTGDGPEGAALVSHLHGQRSAVKMLSDRIQVVQAYLVAVQRGDIPADQAVLRQINGLCNSLPTAAASGKFSEDFLRDYVDTLMVTFLTSVTQSTGTINDVIDKFHMAYERYARRRGIF
eukprot:CAMPEP_0206006886 /NCGR_PEP_ID=MMETSP1464-20131121/5435_1 /ASSEMBLY_ACC=CAM_ASM_001124 /TAXON_ID=119497 /ORGANISM="Exanthemachrysis gayraliae, Strain RCC1523" /LENGTH=285 /DNA_ID=CAMNT_0053380373 /DNA_START=25 /DNA_END=882 /DNA_ORIENTATION=+